MTALTRILNNQIFDNTIVGYQKISPGTITGSLFSSNVTVPGDLLISGNLFVLGSSAYTTIASTNTYVNDPLITLNNGFSGTNTRDIGLILNRGTYENKAIIWSEANKEFRLIGTTETGTTYGNIVTSSYANLHIGNLVVDGTLTLAELIITSINLPGNVIASAAVFNDLTVNGNQALNGNLNVLGNILGSSGTLNGLTVNGDNIVTGYLNVNGNVLTASLSAGQINTTGNVLAAAGVFNGLTVNGSTAITGNLNVTGNILGAVGTLLELGVNGNINATGNVLGAAAIFNSATINGFINSTGNLSATGLDIFGNARLGLVGAVSGSWVDIVGNITQTSAGGPVYFNTTGNISAVTGVFGAINSTGYINTSGNISTAQLNAGQINTTGNLLATAAVTNELTVNGNAAITGYLNISGNVLASDATFSNIQSGGVINAIGNLLASAAIVNSLTVNGVINASGNILGDAATVNLLAVSNSLWANANIATTSQGTGAIVIPNGGISVAGAANIAGAITTAGAAQFNNTLTVGGTVDITNTTNSSEATGVSGALQIKGGASVAKDLWVGGNIYASNIFGVTHQIITVQDPLVYFDAANTYPYNYDIGFYSNFVGPNPIDNTGNVYQHSGVVRDNADNTWKFFSNVQTEPGAGAVTFNADTIYDPVLAGNLRLTYTQAATTTTTGALQVAGGIGVVGTVVAGHLNSTGNVLGQAGTFNSLTVNGNEAITGYLNVTGNILGNSGIFNGLTVNGNEAITGFLNVTGNVLTDIMVANSINASTALIGSIEAANFGNAGATFTGASLNVTGNVLANTVGARFLTASTAAVGNIAAVNFGNAGAIFTGETASFSGNVIGGLAQFAAINSTPIGNVTASTGAFTTLDANGIVTFVNATEAFSLGGGALQVTGGASIGGNLFVGGNLNIIGNSFVISGNSGAFYGNAIGSGALYAGVTGYVPQEFTTIQSTGNWDGYIQINHQNINNGSSASTDFVATADNGTASDTFIDMGINSSQYSQVGYTLSHANDGYLYVHGNLTTGGGNLLLATYHNNDIIFSTGGLDTANEIARFKHGQGLIVEATTPASTSNTGALKVLGGAGIAGNLYVGAGIQNTVIGNVTPAMGTFSNIASTGNIVVNGGAIVNNSQTYDAFQVKGAVTTSLIYADSTYGAVIMGGSNTVPQLGATLKVNSTDSMMIPVGTSGQRPGASGNVDVKGMVRFNSTANNLEFYDGTAWQFSGGNFTVVTDRQLAGNTAYGNVDGVNTVFTIQGNSTTAGTVVSINGVIQFPVLSYSVSGTTLTFTEAPAANDVIDIRVLTTTTTVDALTNGNGLQQFIASDTAAEIWTGTGSTTKQIEINKVGDLALLTGQKVTYTQAAHNIAANNTPYVISTWSQTAFTSAKFVISAKKGSTNVETMEALVVTDGVGNAYVTTYATINNGTAMGNITANVVSGNVRVYYTTLTNMTNANVKAQGTFIV